ncbi:hypothetical protein R3P38DRAFT_2806554 [Favolaschia claudopus]|uniref:Uncharacterized protein n=1 Tax=Favolaschia claudopus TaxID=2862362 RepID=A0AAV9ZJI2_9AGAR
MCHKPRSAYDLVVAWDPAQATTSKTTFFRQMNAEPCRAASRRLGEPTEERHEAASADLRAFRRNVRPIWKTLMAAPLAANSSVMIGINQDRRTIPLYIVGLSN